MPSEWPRPAWVTGLMPVTLGDGSSLWWQVWSSHSGGQCCTTQVTRQNSDSEGERMPEQATVLLHRDKGFYVPSQA